MNGDKSKDKNSMGPKAVLGSFFLLALSLLILFLRKPANNSFLDWDVAIETKDTETILARIQEKSQDSLQIIQYSKEAPSISQAGAVLLEKPTKKNILISHIKYIKFLDYDLDLFLKKYWKEKKPEEKNVGLPPDKYLGVYDIRVLGHKGILSLRVYHGRLVGTLRFPRWAKGVWEGCKNLQIKENRIYFVRSVVTPEERKRIGAPHYFRQVYRGDFVEDGKKIKGRFNSKKEYSIWEGSKR